MRLLVYSNLLASLAASRMAYDAYSGVDWDAFFIFIGALLAALLLGGLRNYVFKRPFLQEAVIFSVVFISLAFVIIWKFTSHNVSLSDQAFVDWLLVPAVLLVFFGVLILTALAVLCSTRLDLLPTLGICYALFLVGLVSDYFFGIPAMDGNMLSQIIYTIIPNWQLYWMADAIQQGQDIPFNYIVRAFFQMTMSVGWILISAILLFEDRELTS